jgi:hypothetical protein
VEGSDFAQTESCEQGDGGKEPDKSGFEVAGFFEAVPEGQLVEAVQQVMDA